MTPNSEGYGMKFVYESDRTMKKELVICVPTYNRQEIIQSMLYVELDILRRYHVDIYIYDSSEGSATEDTVIKFVENGYSNLYYKRINAEVHANRKVYNIYQDMENSSYKYVWMVRDRFVISEEALIYIQKELSLGMPIYWINVLKREYESYKIKDLNEFLRKASCELLRFGTVILSVSAFLKGSNWQYYEKKYLNQKTIHASHVGYYFERCAELEKFEVCRIDLPKSAINDNKTKSASWECNRLQIIAECWGSVIWGLPKCYTCKRDAMHSQDPVMLSKIIILRKKSEGNYGIHEFIKYRKWFRRIRPENYYFYFWAALLPVKILKNMYFSDFIKSIENSVRYIYGAGRIGNECGELLDILGIDYKGYLVCSMEQNPDMKRNHPVMTAQEALCKETATIIIAVSMRTDDIQQIAEDLIHMNGADTLQIIDYNKVRV